MGSFLVGSSICFLCSCSQKVSESNQNGEGYSQHTEVVKEGDHLKTTTVTTEVQPSENKDDTVNITTSDKDGIHVKLPDEQNSDDSVHVRAPLVKVDTGNDDGSVHLRAPFLKIDKSGYGDRVHVRIPGIRINSD